MVQSVAAAVCDASVLSLARRWSTSSGVAPYYVVRASNDESLDGAADVDRSHHQMICQVFNWFVWYCGVRTYSNSMEATLTVAAIALWPFNDAPRFLRGKWIRFAAFD